MASETPHSSKTTDTVHVVVIDREGIDHPMELPTGMGLNMMEVMKASELDVEGTCGGLALCASCHCYVRTGHHLPTPSDDEESMLDQVPYVDDNSRLACQIKVTADIEGLVLELAKQG